MKTYLDCYPCLLRQSIEAARMADATPSQLKHIIQSTLEVLQHLPDGASPPEIGTQVHQLVREITGNDDPYKKVKREATEKALAMLPKLRKLLDASADKLDTAIRLSIAGNIIDFGPKQNYDLWEVVERVLSQALAIDDVDSLRQHLATVDSVLLLADNAGETVFDRLLIEVLEKPVTYVVRGGPVLNDATMADAISAGIDEVALIVDNGARVTGTVLSECSPSFQTRFKAADLILAKGMGNYETLSNVNAPIFFLMQVKCWVIGEDVGASEGMAIVKQVYW